MLTLKSSSCRIHIAAWLLSLTTMAHAQSSYLDRDGVIELTTATVMSATSATLPSATDPDWKPVQLPMINAWRQGYGDSQWYRMPIGQITQPNEIYGIYLGRYSMNAAVYFNGQFLGDGGSFKEPIARNWNRPLYVTIPPALWRESGNEIAVRLLQYPGFGFFGPPQLGPHRVLSVRYQTQVFWQNDMSRIFSALTFGAGLFMLALWMRRKHDGLYLLLALSMFAWCIVSMNFYVRDLVIPARAWWVMAHGAIDWWLVLVTLFYHRLFNLHRPRIERALWFFGAMTSLVYIASDLTVLSIVARNWHSGTLLIGAYLMYVLVKHAHQARNRESVLHLLGVFAILIAGVHDLLMQSGAFNEWWRDGFHLMNYAVPIVMLAITWHITGRFIQALNEQERFNVELEQRVAIATRELADRYDELQTMRDASSRTEERERIYRDLHDDVGAKLLSLIYRSADAPQADLARSALQDLRDVVSRSHADGLTLQEALADWRSECAQRLEAANCRLEWHQGNDLPATTMTPLQVTHLGRILREAVSNAIRHAQPKVVTVSVHYRAPDLVLDVRDDGTTPNVSTWRTGRGLANMQKRAREMSGDIEWRALEPQGCGVLCRIPLTLA